MLQVGAWWPARMRGSWRARRAWMWLTLRALGRAGEALSA